ncbi:hypothetical protein VYU27_008148, partial [Nannochloropsis oceanica]
NLKGLPTEEFKSLAVTPETKMTRQEIEALPLPERYIISLAHELVSKVTSGLEDYDMGDAGQLVYQFLWDEYADWYIEASKTRMSSPPSSPPSSSTSSSPPATTRRVLVYVFDTCLRLLHPFMPYITEVLWQELPHEGQALMVAPWPQEGEERLYVDTEAIVQFRKLQALVRAIRNARAEYRVEPGKKVAAMIQVADPGFRAKLEVERDVLALLGRIDGGKLSVGGIEEVEGGKEGGKAVRLIVEDGLECYLPLADLVDAKKEKERLGKQASKLQGEIEGLEKRVSGTAFLSKAPPELVESTKQALAEKKEQLRTILGSMEGLEG